MDKTSSFSVTVDRSKLNTWEFGELINDISSWPLSKVEDVEAFLKALAPFIPAAKWGKSNSLVISDLNDTEAYFTINRIPVVTATKLEKRKK